MMTSILTGLDALLCILMIAAALEYLRVVHMLERPLLSLSFYCVAAGAFGGGIEIAMGSTPSIWAVLLHVGVVAYAWTHRREIFCRGWQWDGVERRKMRTP